MVRNRKTMGFSHFGAAWIAMAFTCGPHHFVHGIHLLFEGRTGGILDLIAVAIGVPAGVIWFLLRVEAFFGGRGDRFIEGSPGWVLAIPTLFGIYVTALIAGAIDVSGPRLRVPAGGRGEHASRGPLHGDRLVPDAHPARQSPPPRRLVASPAWRWRSCSPPAQ